ncbi:MAG: indolepyruvate ferredoxin oxidoreductase subunit alpha [Desulfocucumaceae bacterium]
MKDLMTGNAAIARGAFESGVTVASGYPGTPSTEILENFCRYQGVQAEWAPNEKVALEVGIGASMAGARVLVTMKHVGVNVAADPLLTAAYTGVNGGLVLVSADDPGMHSSQNEQDNRNYARFAKIPVLEPTDSAEARDMVGLALDISEEFDIPVMLRTTTRVAHSQSFVEIKDPVPRDLKEYKKDTRKWLMVPAFGRMRRQSLAERLERLRDYSEKTPVNYILQGDGKVGVITSGISFQYVREALPGASVLKLGMTYPLPAELIKKFASGVEKLFVLEELEPYIEEFVRILGLPVAGSEFFPETGELGVAAVKKGFISAGVIPGDAGDCAMQAEDMPAVPMRPPVLCAGCPHRGVFYALRKLKLVVTGDIGCYTLGGLAPLEGMDSCVCMGASIGMSHGIDMAAPGLRGRTVAVIGDSTFFHSGITGLINVIYNNGNTTVLILDNSTTAMTGHQEHPATGKTLMGKEAPVVDLEGLVKALGVKRVRTVDPLNLLQLTEVIKEEVEAPGPSVVIARRPCVLVKREPAPAITVDRDLCTGCKTCLRLGCPAISVKDKVSSVDSMSCTGCGLCTQVCKFGALIAAEGGVAGA